MGLKELLSQSKKNSSSGGENWQSGGSISGVGKGATDFCLESKKYLEGKEGAGKGKERGTSQRKEIPRGNVLPKEILIEDFALGKEVSRRQANENACIRKKNRKEETE